MTAGSSPAAPVMCAGLSQGLNGYFKKTDRFLKRSKAGIRQGIMVNPAGINGFNFCSHNHHSHVDRFYRSSRSFSIKDLKFSIHEISI